MEHNLALIFFLGVAIVAAIFLLWAIVAFNELRKIEKKKKLDWLLKQINKGQATQEEAKQSNSTKTQNTKTVSNLPKHKQGYTDKLGQAVERASTRMNRKSGQSEWKEGDFHTQ